MRGLLTAIGVMGAIWTGGLLWSIGGGLVLVPQVTVVSIGAPAAPAAPASTPAPKPTAAADDRMIEELYKARHEAAPSAPLEP